MPEILKTIPEGAKVTLKVATCFGGLVEEKATFIGNVRQHGYISGNGSWGLYPFRNGGEPCYVFDARLYKQRNISTLRWRFTVKGISMGWEVPAMG